MINWPRSAAKAGKFDKLEPEKAQQKIKLLKPESILKYGFLAFMMCTQSFASITFELQVNFIPRHWKRVKSTRRGKSFVEI